jgi:hypothetical protein
MTAKVLRWNSLLPATPRTFDGKGTNVAAVATGGFIAHPHAHMIAHRPPVCEGHSPLCLKAMAYWPQRGSAWIGARRLTPSR